MLQVYSNTHSRVLAVKAQIGAIQKKQNKTKFKQGLFKFYVSCKIDYSASERKSVNAEFFLLN